MKNDHAAEQGTVWREKRLLWTAAVRQRMRSEHMSGEISREACAAGATINNGEYVANHKNFCTKKSWC